MLIKRPPDINESEVTDERLYLSRRRFIRTAATIGAGLGLTAAGGSILLPRRSPSRGRRLSTKPFTETR